MTSAGARSVRRPLRAEDIAQLNDYELQDRIEFVEREMARLRASPYDAATCNLGEAEVQQRIDAIDRDLAEINAMRQAPPGHRTGGGVNEATGA